MFLPYPDEQWKRPLISGCLGYIGDCTTRLIIGTLINHEIRIPIKQPGFPMESQAVLFSWLRCVGRFNMGRLKGPTAGTLVGDPLSRGSSWAFLDFPRCFCIFIHGFMVHVPAVPAVAVSGTTLLILFANSFQAGRLWSKRFWLGGIDVLFFLQAKYLVK